jgi:Raf kinase inhibitor-like YbhB/YbcL family protein
LPIKITSSAFAEGGMIPRQYTCDGRDVSPPLSWTGIPSASKSLALIGDDPDAPGKTWVHWVIYALPPGTAGLPEGVPPSEEIPGGGRQGTNDFRKIGYGGPCPPRGTHRYFFKVYALDTEVELPAGATKAQLERAMEGNVLEQGTLMGRYART